MNAGAGSAPDPWLAAIQARAAGQAPPTAAPPAPQAPPVPTVPVGLQPSERNPYSAPLAAALNIQAGLNVPNTVQTHHLPANDPPAANPMAYIVQPPPAEIPSWAEAESILNPAGLGDRLGLSLTHGDTMIDD